MESRYDAGAVEADIIRVRFLALVSVGIRTFRPCEMHYNDDGEPPLHSAHKSRVRRHGSVAGRRAVGWVGGPILIRGA